MKLIEVDDRTLLSCNNNIDDESYSKPRVLSTLDDVMNEILRAQISDADKWRLYSQALQRYLNHTKLSSRKKDSDLVIPNDTNANSDIEKSSETNTFNFSLGSVGNSFPNDLNMTGIEPMRNSLDSLSQESVRSFFENARSQNLVATHSQQDLNSPQSQMPQLQPIQHTSNASIQKAKNTQSSNRRMLPYRNNMPAASRKRRAQNNLSANMSQMRPCKVVVQPLNWDPTSAR